MLFACWCELVAAGFASVFRRNSDWRMVLRRMKYNKARKVALAISLGTLALALGLRFMGLPPTIPQVMSLVSLAASGVAIFVSCRPGLDS